MQAIARWGNFFNQELYGPPTTLPWGIPIDCAHRVAAYPCGPEFPDDDHALPPAVPVRIDLGRRSARSSLIWIGFHLRKRLRPGDLLLIFFIWYGVVRFVLEIAPRRQLDVLRGADRPGRLGRLHRRRGADHPGASGTGPGHPLDDPPTHPEVATWGAIGRPVDVTT